MTQRVVRVVFFVLLAQACFAGGAPKEDGTHATVVSRPDLTSQNSFYPGNRAPLKPAHLIKLPLGSIQAGCCDV